MAGWAAVFFAILLATAFAAPAANASPGAKPRATYWTWVNYNSSKCLGVAGGNMTNGTHIVQWTCNGHADQSWGAVGINNGLYYEFRNSANPNKCLGVPGSSTSEGVQLVIWDCNGHDDQFWAVVDLGGPCWAIANLNSGYIIGVGGGSTADGAPVVQWRWQNHPDQNWC